MIATERWQTVEFTPSIAIAAGALEDFHGDPADRMIVATAQSESAVLVSKDRRIRDWCDRTSNLTCIWD